MRKCLLKKIWSFISTIGICKNRLSQRLYPGALFILLILSSENSFSQITYTNLGPQLFSTTIEGSAFYKAGDGKIYLYTVVRGQPAHLLGYDLSNNSLVTNIALEETTGASSIVFSSDGILYIGASGSNVYTYTPGNSTVNNLGAVFGTETALYDLRSGNNGAIYGGTYPGCRVFRYHPNEGFSDAGSGPIVPGENYVRSMAYNKNTNKIYAGVGAHASLIELDLTTGSKRNILPSTFSDQQFVYSLTLIEDLSGGDRLFITVQNAAISLVYNITTETFEYQGKEVYTKAAIKSPAGNEVYFTQGNKLLSYPNIAFGNYAPVFVTNISSNARASAFIDGILYTLTTTGEVIKYDQSNCIVSKSNLIIPGQPDDLITAHKGPANTIWTSAHVTGANSSYNPATGISQIFEGMNQTESAGLYNDKLYFGTYTKSRFYVYDSNLPWNMGSNPKLLGSATEQDRPFGGLGIPEEGKVFFGTVPAYGANGGVLVEFDVNSNNLMTQYTNVVSNQSIISLAYNNGKLFGGTSIWGGLGSTPVATEAKLFVWDIATKTKVHEITPVSGARAITCLINGNDGYIWGYAQGYLFKIDPSNYNIVSSSKILNDTRSSHLWRPDNLVFNAKDNMYYASIAHRIYKLDPQNMVLTALDRLGAYLTLGPDSEMYFFRGPDLWKMEIN